MNIIAIPDLKENPHIIQPTVIDGKTYIFEYNSLEEFVTLSIILDDKTIISGRALTLASDLIGRVKDDTLIKGRLFLLNKYGKKEPPTQENLKSDFALARVNE